MRGAEISECRTWRYRLWRVWDADKPALMFIMLNPSTADEQEDDPTIRRCVGFAKAWGFGGISVCNLFAFRATDPAELRDAADPVGPENDRILLEVATSGAVGLVLAAWGNYGGLNYRSGAVREMLRANGVKLMALSITKAKEPGHPLYIKADTCPLNYG